MCYLVREGVMKMWAMSGELGRLIEFHHQLDGDSGTMYQKLVGNDVKYSIIDLISN